MEKEIRVKSDSGTHIYVSEALESREVAYEYIYKEARACIKAYQAIEDADLDLHINSRENYVELYVNKKLYYKWTIVGLEGFVWHMFGTDEDAFSAIFESEHEAYNSAKSEVERLLSVMDVCNMSFTLTQDYDNKMIIVKNREKEYTFKIERI